jgi:tetratricopeptide (TPR) repeat protein
MYFQQEKYGAAEPLYRRALDIRDKTLGPLHPLTGVAAQNLAGLYKAQSNFDEADALYKRSLSIFEESAGPDSPEVGSVLDAVSSMYAIEGKYAEALPIYARLVEVEERAFGQQSLVLANTLDGYAQASRKLGQDAKAGELEDRAKTIRGAQPKTPTATSPAHVASSKSSQPRPN